MNVSTSNENVNLLEWIAEHNTEEELRSLFLNLDIALKYIHEHGYCISVFYPTEIEILDNRDDYIKFNKLVELSSNFSQKKKMIQEDIFNSSLIQIGLYSNSLKYLTPQFLKENFDSFSQFIPPDDIQYYRGVVLRGASVYLSEYAKEKTNRELIELEKQFGDGSVDSNNLSIKKNIYSNDYINDKIYSQINGYKDAAFIRILSIPTYILFFASIITLLLWLCSILQ